MGDIYLKHKNDHKSYAKCYSELVLKDPSVENCILLGKAYLNINEPEKAVKIFQSTFKQNPTNTELQIFIGKSFCQMHEYEQVCFFQTRL
jgi:hypothetical protein